jgi:hypothetical protein
MSFYCRAVQIDKDVLVVQNVCAGVRNALKRDLFHQPSITSIRVTVESPRKTPFRLLHSGWIQSL